MPRSNPERGFGLCAAYTLVLCGLVIPSPVGAQDLSVLAAPDRAEGEGPFARMIVRGAKLIDGTGAPPIGPVDVVVEGNRIVEVVRVGVPGIPVQPSRRPAATADTYEIDAEGMFLLPGLVDVHAHIGFTLAGGSNQTGTLMGRTGSRGAPTTKSRGVTTTCCG